MASSSSKPCFNPDCKNAKVEQLRRGWPFRAGGFAELCERCASLYEEGRFCATFHRSVAGWRNCGTCGKPLHCGCIASAHEFILLDAGGLICMACHIKNPDVAINQSALPYLMQSMLVSERLKDLSSKNWNSFAAPDAVSGQLWQSPSKIALASAPSELLPWTAHEIERSDDCDKLVSGVNYPMKVKEVGSESGLKTPVAVMSYPSSSVNTSVQPSTANEDPSSHHFDLPVPYRSSDVIGGSTRVSETQPQRRNPPPPLVRQFCGNSHNGVESSGETQMRNGRPRDSRGRNQLLPLPRYWPKITDQELQKFSGDSNAVITPLFEKILSASDAGRIGRLVLPKKCAEAYLPPISQPEGIPLRVQDLKGNEWTFQFRYWPNNNSRMYVLEGVTPCIQSMQLQAGDTVTFSRLDPEGKLVMGFRKDAVAPKAGSSVSTQAEVTTTDHASAWSKLKQSGFVTKEGLGAKPSFVPSKRKSTTIGSRSKRLRVENEERIELMLKWEDGPALLRPPLNNAPTIIVIEGLEIEEYEEVPIIGKPTIFTEDCTGKKFQWAQCEDCSKWRKLPLDALLPSRWTCSDNLWDKKRSSCLSEQELTTRELHERLNSSNSASSEKVKSVKKEADAVEGSEGLDTLANLAILGECVALPPSAQLATTKHPRHKPGCSCIVCIQPPSGQFPKHSETCMCTACLIVKRRFRTLTERRGKRQLENETETRQQKQQQFEKAEQVDDPLMGSNISNDGLNQEVVVNGIAEEDSNQKKLSSSPLKGCIDLNIKPERDDESFPVSESGSVMTLSRDGTDQYVSQLQFGGSSRERDDQIEPSGCGNGENTSGAFLGSS